MRCGERDRAVAHSDVNCKERTSSVIVYDNDPVNPSIPLGMLLCVMREDSGLWGNSCKTNYRDAVLKLHGETNNHK